MTLSARDGNAEGGGEKMPVSEGDEESGEEEEESGEEEEENGGIGEQFFPSRGEEDEEAADGGPNTAVAPGGRAKNPATLLEKRGTIRKSISEAGKDWEKKLPLVLYAIRTHVQTSTGHSPFELLFGRQLRTLLEMLAEQWEETEEEVKELLTYTRELRENLHKVWEEAHTTLREAQTKQK
ncbi:hypothetical protein NDU88_005708 [Pleurodeles waltl]|uniref:Uncharacterized protein n=1 Tax=Pleurodeles waltl TaxID=8319 RepID=A0AAV7RN50_PLEWA|nr:hypothetical protein NDU88_005708 [Pleurodeles waltl]